MTTVHCTMSSTWLGRQRSKTVPLQYDQETQYLAGYNEICATRRPFREGEGDGLLYWRPWYLTIHATSSGSQTQGRATFEDAWQCIVERIEFTRGFWMQKVKWAEKGEADLGMPVFRIEGQHYLHDPRNVYGFGGHTFSVKVLKTGQIRRLTLWHQGMIPLDLRDVLPDNAEWA